MNMWNLWIDVDVTANFIAYGLLTTHILTWSIISWSFDHNLCWSCQFFMTCRVVKVVIYIFKIGFCKHVMCLDLHVDLPCSHIGHQQFTHNTVIASLCLTKFLRPSLRGSTQSRGNIILVCHILFEKYPEWQGCSLMRWPDVINQAFSTTCVQSPNLFNCDYWPLTTSNPTAVYGTLIYRPS